MARRRAASIAATGASRSDRALPSPSQPPRATHWKSILPMRLPFFYGWLIVAVVFVTMGIGVNARTAFSLLFPPILEEFRWDRGVTAGAFSFGFVVSAILSPVLGRMMDRVGPRAVMELGVGLMAAGLLLAPLAQRAVAPLSDARRPGRRRQRVPGLLRPVAVPAQLVRAPARHGDRHRLCRRRRGLHHPAALGAAGDRGRRLARRLPRHGHPAAGRAGAHQPAAAQAAGGHGAAARRRRRAERSAAPPPSNVVNEAWAAVDWTLWPRHAHARRSGGSRWRISPPSTPGTRCRCTRPSTWWRSASARRWRRGRWVSSACSASPGRSRSATSPTASAGNGYGPSPARASPSASWR